MNLHPYDVLIDLDNRQMILGLDITPAGHFIIREAKVRVHLNAVVNRIFRQTQAEETRVALRE